MKYFEQHHVEEIRQRADIVSYIQRFVPLHKKGARFLGVCPFHNDKSPSMNVNPTIGLYKCFACGAGGDVFKFAMEHDKMDFPSAVISVAEWLGYQLPEREVHKVQTNQKHGLLEVMSYAERHFAKNLAQNPEILKYLADRGLGPELIASFNLGYAKPEWDDLLRATTQAGIGKHDLNEAGLIVVKDDGKSYDRYRQRFIIPIQNLGGKVVAFGGRALDPNENAKYINSPETSLYKKSELLFGLSHSKRAIVDAGEFYVVEGYMDFLQMWQHGVQNACAVSGTALTPQHVTLLKRFAKRAILLFDGDNAGRKAARRSIPLLLEGGIEVLILDFPEGEDPDSLLKNQGKAAFEALRPTAKGWIDWICADLHDLSTPEDKAAIAKELRDFLGHIPDPIIRQGYARKAASTLGLQEKWMQSGAAPEAPVYHQPSPPMVQNAVQKRKAGAEKRMVEWILRHQELLPLAAKQMPLELLRHPDFAEIMDHALQLSDEGQYDPKKLYDRLSPMHRDLLAQLEIDLDPLPEELALREYLQMLTRMMLDDVERKLELLPKTASLYEELTRWDEVSKRSQIQNLRELSRQIFPSRNIDQVRFHLFLDTYNNISSALRNPEL